MFHSAALKLTLWYLAIIMAVSLVFSATLYHVSSDDLDRNVNRQIGYFNNFLGPDQSLNYGHLRQRQLTEDLDHLKASLISFNLLVLIGGGAASYWLARRTLDPIEAALKAQSRFASDASHELRTPLTSIQTENEVALRNKSITKPEAINLIKSNLEEVAKLKALSEGLLRLANGQGTIEKPEPVDLSQAAQAAIDRYQKAADLAGSKITNAIGEQTAMGDNDSLVELLSIFIDNAVKYGGGKPIRLAAIRHGRQIAVSIEDRGQGIAADDLPHIFERFYQSDSSRHKAQAGGYGLGLAIAKNLVEAHHGHIEVTSTPGRGTKFTVFLPAA
jgi:two-component system sensor histidine kinase CiaH